MVKKLSPLIPIYLFVLILFYPSLTTYFSQDDFFHIKIAQTDGTLKSFINLFGFYPFEERGVAFYRPVFRELFYNIFYNLFGLSQYPYRIFAFLIHFINIALVFTFTQKLFNKKKTSFFAALFFGVSSVNVATLYYLTGGIQALGATMFLLLSLFFSWKYLEEKKFKFKIASFALFLFALASHEQAVVSLPLLAGLIFLKFPAKQFVSKTIKELWFPCIILFLYLYLELFVIGFSKTEIQYQASTSIKRTLNTFSWYVAWAEGIPEMLIDFVEPGLKLKSALMRYWGGYYKVIFPALLGALLVLFLNIPVFLKKKKEIFTKKLLFCLAWFILGIAPVVLLPLHKSTYYLTIALPGFWIAVSVFAVQLKTKPLVLLITLLLILNITSIKLGESTYWAASRGKIAEKLINDVKTKYPALPQGALLYFENDSNYPFVAAEWGGTSKQASFILNGSDALRLLYKDPTIKVYYEDVEKPPVNTEIFTLVAEIN